MERRALVIGHRAGLVKALQRLQVPAHFWVPNPIKPALVQGRVTVQPFGGSPSEYKEHARALTAHGPFTHVIACTESAVVPASHARRELGARRSVHTKILRCHNKLLMKELLRQQSIPMTDFVSAREALTGPELIARLGSPLVLKSVDASGGRGIEFVSGESITGGVSLKGRIAERYVDAPEISVESFINHRKILFTNVTEYAVRKHVNVLPGALKDEVREAVLRLNKQVIEALQLDWGMTHLEMYLTKDGPLFGEIALRPPGGYLMELLTSSYGFDAWEAFARVELDLPFSPPSTKPSYSAAIVLHPGEGRIRCIPQLDALKSDPMVTTAKLRVAPGDEIKARLGVGTDVGHVLLNHPHHAPLRKRARQLNTDLHAGFGLDKA